METNNLNVFSLCLMSTYGSHKGKKICVLLINYHLSLQIPYTDTITVTVK